MAELARAFGAVAEDTPYFLAGATARNLLLEYAHGINPGRNTRDVDLALMVGDWPAFETLRSRLINGGRFVPSGTALHKLRFDDTYELDLIPFGAIEEADRTIIWPPDGSVVMGVFGFREVYEDTLNALLPGDTSIRIVSLPALVVLKLVAWEDRRLRRPGTDAHDIAIVLRRYLEAGNLDRLYTQAAHLLEAPDFDYENAGAWLLGHDIARLLPDSARPRMAELLNRESDVNGAVRLVGDLPIEADRGLRLLQHLSRGFMETVYR